ncbi:hypothetical protein ASG07_03810 [Sphingomonas sp. Leaf343]|nr:hypothetical protein ASG07_03810 [Sphingomonas sp. Leaf343]
MYEAALEGGLTMMVPVYRFWRTDAGFDPADLAGTGLTAYGTARFPLDRTLAWRTCDGASPWVKRSACR